MRPSGSVASCSSGSPRIVMSLCNSAGVVRGETTRAVGPLPSEVAPNGLSRFRRVVPTLTGVIGSRVIRPAMAVAVIVVAGFLAASALATSRSERSLRTLNHQVLAAVNSFRVAHGLVPVRESKGLDSAARQHSLEMGKLGYFAHNSANGTSFWRRIQHYYGSRNYGQWSVGENLLWSSPTVSAGHA